MTQAATNIAYRGRYFQITRTHAGWEIHGTIPHELLTDPCTLWPRTMLLHATDLPGAVDGAAIRLVEIAEEAA